MSKHTPGAWRVGKNVYGEPLVIAGKRSKTSKGIVTAIIKTPSIYWTADANLIAAAPEMLAALKRLVDLNDGAIDSEVAAIDQANDAIAKAEGGDL